MVGAWGQVGFPIHFLLFCLSFLMEALLNYSQLYYWNVPSVFTKTQTGAGKWEEQRCGSVRGKKGFSQWFV